MKGYTVQGNRDQKLSVHTQAHTHLKVQTDQVHNLTAKNTD